MTKVGISGGKQFLVRFNWECRLLSSLGFCHRLPVRVWLALTTSDSCRLLLAPGRKFGKVALDLLRVAVG